MIPTTISPINIDDNRDANGRVNGQEGDSAEETEGMNFQEEPGSRVPRKVQDPMPPSQEERKLHELTHLPFRSWCRHCVRGCGQAEPHRRTARDSEAVPEIHMDYCFMGTTRDEAQPILVVRERDTRLTLSFLVREKGASDPYVVRRILAFIKEVGLEAHRIIIKSGQESPIRAVVDKLILAREQGATLPEHSPVRSSGSNGVIERAVKEVEMRVRCMKSALDERTGIDILSTCAILPWMVDYASVLINRYLVGRGGKTAYERTRGKTSKMLGFEFGEMAHFAGAHFQAGWASWTHCGPQGCMWATGPSARSI